jgi:hypothetical protein
MIPMLTGAAILAAGITAGWYLYANHAHTVCAWRGLYMRFITESEDHWLQSWRDIRDGSDPDITRTVERLNRELVAAREKLASQGELLANAERTIGNLIVRAREAEDAIAASRAAQDGGADQ